MTVLFPSQESKDVFGHRAISESQKEKVLSIIEGAAELLDELESIEATNGESGRCKALAKTKLEEMVMWANKAISRQ
jgi:hypothetical protein